MQEKLSNVDFSINDRLKELRIELGFKQKEFAKELDTTQSYYSDLENHKREVPAKVIKILVNKFAYSANWIITGNGFQKIHNVDILKKSEGEEQEASSLTKEEYEAQHAKNYQNLLEELEKKRVSPKPVRQDEFTLKVDNLRKLKKSYHKRIRRELQDTNPKLYNILNLIDNSDAMIDLLSDVVLNYVYLLPDPFDALNYVDVKNDTDNIPDTINYKQFKDDVIERLEGISDYEEAIREFYEDAKKFLAKLKPLDKNGLIE